MGAAVGPGFMAVLVSQGPPPPPSTFPAESSRKCRPVGGTANDGFPGPRPARKAGSRQIRYGPPQSLHGDFTAQAEIPNRMTCQRAWKYPTDTLAGGE